MTPKEHLMRELMQEGVLKSPRSIDAFLAIDRADFVPDEVKGYAYMNEALSIGWGQTISQPSVVAFMLELLDPQPNEKILDIGCGSGWTTALLTHMAGEKGKVFGIEIIPELAEHARKNVSRYNFLEKGRAHIITGDGAQGCSEEAPFDKILVSASLQVTEIPGAWSEQLRVDGKIVLPIKNSIWMFQKTGRSGSEDPSGSKRDATFLKKEYPGFVFVPFK
ncbi:MAG: protein-L-isoaspartate O-methyltransferase [Candidatus Yanofskybacteria bacterium]|nr:protein-L-isoaspartate O-methyltransferase [Candidatus Yanofskybacteria bacterium]